MTRLDPAEGAARLFCGEVETTEHLLLKSLLLEGLLNTTQGEVKVYHKDDFVFSYRLSCLNARTLQMLVLDEMCIMQLLPAATVSFFSTTVTTTSQCVPRPLTSHNPFKDLLKLPVKPTFQQTSLSNYKLDEKADDISISELSVGNLHLDRSCGFMASPPSNKAMKSFSLLNCVTAGSKTEQESTRRLKRNNEINAHPINE